MKTTKRILLGALAVLLVTACRKDKEVEQTEGALILTTDWADRSEGIEIPDKYTARVGSFIALLESVESPYPYPLVPGVYPLHIYNKVDEIPVDGTTATVTTNGNTVDPQPGWLFTYAAEVAIEGTYEHRYTARMIQQVRQLSIELIITEGNPDRIKELEATLSGIANTVDFETHVHAGENLHVVPVFTRTDNKLTTHVRLLGISGQDQLLTLELTFDDGRSQTIETNISGQLGEFNSNKHVPLQLTANLNLPVDAAFEATVTNWEVNEEHILVN